MFRPHSNTENSRHRTFGTSELDSERGVNRRALYESLPGAAASRASELGAKSARMFELEEMVLGLAPVADHNIGISPRFAEDVLTGQSSLFHDSTYRGPLVVA